MGCVWTPDAPPTILWSWICASSRPTTLSLGTALCPVTANMQTPLRIGIMIGFVTVGWWVSLSVLVCPPHLPTLTRPRRPFNPSAQPGLLVFNLHFINNTLVDGLRVVGWYLCFGLHTCSNYLPNLSLSTFLPGPNIYPTPLPLHLHF